MTAESRLSAPRFEYGRHETFTIRHGWLGKGLARLDSPEGFHGDTRTADALGLGSRMVKSLSYWLEATALAENIGDGRVRHLAVSEIGKLIEARDPYFEYPATWWFVHLALAGRDGSVFSWFFNDYAERNFERTDCVDAFLRHAKQHTAKAPTLQTAQRDVACVLASYAIDPSEPQDPEDGAVCPLGELRLVVHHRDTRRFEKVRPLDRIPLEVFLAAAARVGQDTGEETLSAAELLSRRNGPGRLLGMTGDMVDAAATESARALAKDGVTYSLIGAERRLRVPPHNGAHWLASHYARIGVGA
jgi:hypothetical protein